MKNNKYALLALAAAICGFSSMSCGQSEKTTIIREKTPDSPSGVDVKVQGGKSGGVEVDVHGKTDN